MSNKLMNDSTKKRMPDELYREYQNTRDDIPEAIFNDLVSKAEQVQHDDSIHQILQQAKVRDNTQARSAVQTPEQKSSFSDRIKRLLYRHLEKHGAQHLQA